jgi:hypothetical protein
VAQVFLLPAPALNPSPVIEGGRDAAEGVEGPAVASQRALLASKSPQPDGPQLAVVNLTSAFVAGHPSGIEPETLTVLSICGTLHANLPRITQVRFLVDGQTRATLAGHADLSHIHLAGDTPPAQETKP